MVFGTRNKIKKVDKIEIKDVLLHVTNIMQK